MKPINPSINEPKQSTKMPQSINHLITQKTERRNVGVITRRFFPGSPPQTYAVAEKKREKEQDNRLRADTPSVDRRRPKHTH